MRKNSSEPKRKYAKISLKKRESLVDLVLRQGLGLTYSSKKLNLKLSTAKLILRKFKLTGEFHMRKGQHQPETRSLASEFKQKQRENQVFAVESTKGEAGGAWGNSVPQFWSFEWQMLYFPWWPVDNLYQFL